MRDNSYDPALIGAPTAGRYLARVWRTVSDGVRKVDATLALWHFRASYRRELTQLDERLLKDAGVDRFEAYKPFWRG